MEASAPSFRYFTWQRLPVAVSLIVSMWASSCGAIGSSTNSKARIIAIDALSGRSIWTAEAPASSGPLLAVGGVVIASGVDDCRSPVTTIVALDAQTGRQRWRAKSPGPTRSSCRSPAPNASERVVVIQSSGTAEDSTAFQAIDPRTGKQMWSARGAGVAVGDAVIVEGEEGQMLGLDAATGANRWTSDPRFWSPLTGGLGPWMIKADGSSAYILGQEHGRSGGLGVSAIDLETGVERWHTAVGLPSNIGSLLAADPAVVFSYASGGGPEQQISSLDPATGEVRWHHAGLRQSLAASDGLVYQLAEIRPGPLEVRDALSGTIRWSDANIDARGGLKVARG